MILIENETYTKREFNKMYGEIVSNYRDSEMIILENQENKIFVNKKSLINYMNEMKKYKNIIYKLLVFKEKKSFKFQVINKK